MLFPDIGINKHEYMNSCLSEQVDRNRFLSIQSLVLQILNRQSFQKKLFQSKSKQKRIIKHTKTTCLFKETLQLFAYPGFPVLQHQ